MENPRYVTYRRSAKADSKLKNERVLFIDNRVARKVLAMEDCLNAVEDAYREFGEHRATASRAAHHAPRRNGGWHRWAPMASAIPRMGVLALRMTSDVLQEAEGKIDFYCFTPGKFCGLILLFSIEDGRPLAIMNDGHIQHMRVGATGALSVKYMARENATTLGILGSAGMATAHLWAITKVRKISRVKIFSPNPQHRTAFARRMSRDLGVEIVAVDEPRDAIQGSDIVAACTNSTRPVVKGAWMEKGMHLLSVSPQEFDDDVYRRCDRYAYSRPNTSENYIAAPIKRRLPILERYIGTEWLIREKKLLPKSKGFSFPDVISKKVKGRLHKNEITCFTSRGTPIQFTAAAHRVYELAKARGLGRKLPLSWFLQDIRN